MRGGGNGGFDVGQAHVGVLGYFGGIGDGYGVADAGEYMVILVLYEAIAEAGIVYKGEGFLEWAGEAHLFLQATVSCCGYILAGAGVAATGVGPLEGRVVLACGTLLQE